MYKVKSTVNQIEYMKRDGIIFNKSVMVAQVANEIIRNKELKPSKQMNGWDLETQDGSMLFHSSDLMKAVQKKNGKEED